MKKIFLLLLVAVSLPLQAQVFTEADRDFIVRADFGGGLGDLPVDRDPPACAGFVRDGPAFDDPGNLQEFINAHKQSSIQKK